jgi:hypothetical protein
MQKTSIIALAFAAAACTGGEKAPETTTAASTPSLTPEQVRAKQQHYADSVLNTASPASEMAKKLGPRYEVAGTMLRDTVSAFIQKAGCFPEGRKTDPYLAGIVTIWVNMGIAGSEVIRIQESKWSSLAGDLVNTCISTAAAKWKFDPSYGKPKAYLVQVEFKDVAPAASKAP